MEQNLYLNNRRKRESFLETLKVEKSAIGTTVPSNPYQRIDNKRLRKTANRYYSLPEDERADVQRRRAEREARRKQRARRITGVNRDSKKYKGNRKLMSKAIAIGLTGIVALSIFAGTQIHNSSMETQNGRQLEAISQDSGTLERLGIDKEDIEELQLLQAEFESNQIESLSNEDLINLGNRVQNVQVNTIKSKLSSTLGIPEESIELRIDYSDDVPKASIVINENGETKIYNNDGIFDFNNNISSDISNYIINIGDTQTANSRLKNGTIDKSKAINQYKSALSETNDIALKQISRDENGNISLSLIPQQEIDSLIQDDDER